jgi:hypothetical protein
MKNIFYFVGYWVAYIRTSYDQGRRRGYRRAMDRANALTL